MRARNVGADQNDVDHDPGARSAVVNLERFRPPRGGPRGRSSEDWCMLGVLVALFTLCLGLIGFYVHSVTGSPADSGLWNSGPGKNAIHAPRGETEVFNGDEEVYECMGKIRHPYNRGAVCEGYWRTTANVTAGAFDENYPFPEARTLPFCGQLSWLRRLKYVEAKAREDPEGSGVRIDTTRGLSPSRLEPGKLLGNKEFVDEDSGGPTFHVPLHRHGPVEKHRVCWTGDFSSYYVEKFNVIPSHDFYFYVLGKYGKLEHFANGGR